MISTRRGTLNAALLVIAAMISALALWGASHASHVALKLLAVFVFSYSGNTLFALLHEAVHGVLFESERANRWGGRFAAAWFPTGLAFQRALHLNHHQHNRDVTERFDYLQPGESRFLKSAQWYSILTGLYWVFAALGAVAWLFTPFVFPLLRRRERFAKQTAASTYFAALETVPPVVSRIEVLCSLAFQVALFGVLDLHWAWWLACYAAFAWQWSALQYADHAWSPLHATEGAWDLKVPRVHRWLFLNYHLHRAHHRSPKTPWFELPALASESGPSFWSVYLSMWRGPRVLGAPEPAPLDVGFRALIVTGVALAFLVTYGGASWLSGFVPWRVRLDLPFEQAVPFVPWVSVVYLSMDLLVGLAPVVLRDLRKLTAFAAVLITQMLIAAVFFVAMPVADPFPPRVVEGSASAAFWLADTLNLERNFFPSLHVAFSVAAARAYGGRAWWLWATAIAASTMLLHEHCLIDVIGGTVLALAVHALFFERWVRADFSERLRTEWLVFKTLWRVGLRHPRYVVINVALYGVALVTRGRRALRTGYALLQLVDDVLDGDRPLPREANDHLSWAESLAARLTGTALPSNGDAERLVDAFKRDAPVQGVEVAVRLITTMSKDFTRRSARTEWSETELRAHHRATFSDSLEVLLVCGGSEVRASALPSMVDLLAWASVVRDLEEDLSRGLINLPRGVKRGVWLADEAQRARGLMLNSEAELRALDDRRAAKWLGVIARSTRKYLS